jgi:hypothetical protein
VALVASTENGWLADVLEKPIRPGLFVGVFLVLLSLICFQPFATHAR